MPIELPEDYFNKFPDRIFSRLENDEDSDYSSELISSIDKISPYMVPDGYFVALPNQIISKHKRDNANQTKNSVKYLRPLRWISVAATLALIVMYSYQSEDIMISDPALSEKLELPDTSKLLTEEEGLIWEELIDEYTDEEIWMEAMAELVHDDDPINNFLNDIADEDLDLYLDVLLADMTDIELISL